ncbi:MAG: NEW3 domain-containing protein [Acidobacteriota bacterium]
MPAGADLIGTNGMDEQEILYPKPQRIQREKCEFIPIRQTEDDRILQRGTCRMLILSPLHLPSRIHRRRLSLIALFLIACILCIHRSDAQNKFPLLDFKKVQASYEKAKSDYERKKREFDYGIISERELDDAKITLTNQEVEYQKALVNMIVEEQYVSIVGGMQYQDEDGRKRVSITLENTSGSGDEYASLLNLDAELMKALRSDVIHNVYVSLSDDDEAIISHPYEAKIEQLYFGKPVKVDFALLRDLDAVTVNITYGNGSERSQKISLLKDEKVNKVIIQSEQFSQEAELGDSADFDLTLELFSGQNDTFQLEVVHLPSQLNRYFYDTSSEARLSQFKFTEGNKTRQAALKVLLPDRPGEGIEIGKRILFYALVIPRDRVENLGMVRGRTWTGKEIEALDVGFVRLELVPRGKGVLVVRAPQLYFPAFKEESIEIALDMKNEGTRSLDNVQVEVDAPLHWAKEVEPQLLRDLDVNDEKQMVVRVTPPPDIAQGKYEVRVKSSALSDTQPVDGEDKTITVEIKEEANVTGIAIIVSAIVILVLGIVIFGIRLSRR